MGKVNWKTVGWELFVWLASIACMVRLLVWPTNLFAALTGIGVIISSAVYLLSAGALDHLEWWQEGSSNRWYTFGISETEYRLIRDLAGLSVLLYFIFFAVNVLLTDTAKIYHLLVGGQRMLF